MDPSHSIKLCHAAWLYILHSTVQIDMASLVEGRGGVGQTARGKDIKNLEAPHYMVSFKEHKCASPGKLTTNLLVGCV